MKSGYLYLDEAEMLLIKNLLQKNKDEESNSLVLKLDSYKNNYWDLKNKNFNNFRNLKFSKWNSFA
mgnify:CR=1 FL=1